jgi:aminoglycoside/choline kinase family phosphotransferase
MTSRLVILAVWRTEERKDNGNVLAFVSPSSTVSAAPVTQDRLAELVRRTYGLEGGSVAIGALPGGARARRYFRVALPEGRSAVAMFDPEGGRPEEVQKAYDSPRWPFLEVRDLLAEHGVDVPTVIAEDTDNGWLLIEDLGDYTLANWLLKNPGDREPLYRRAVCDLARAQNELAMLPEGSVVANRTFDFELLRWEIEHFKEWALDARGRSFDAPDARLWQVLADRLADRLAQLPRGFVHRDYQSRNIMVVPGHPPEGPRLVWIDFQDALLGPRVYDLVALLNDSYQQFDRAFVEARLADYADAAALDHHATDAESRSRLEDEFDLLTIQRKMKDAGRFVFIDRRKGNPSFRNFVGPTIKKVGRALERLAPRDYEMAELRRLLQRALGDELGA